MKMFFKETEMLKLLFLAILLTSVTASELDQLKEQVHNLEIAVGQLLRQNAELQHQNQELRQKVKNQNEEVKHQNIEFLKRLTDLETGKTTPYNTTIEELEIRVERLEEDMFEAQGDIIENIEAIADNRGSIAENQGAINTLEFSLQETVETVMDHTNNLDSLETTTEELENITSEVRNDVLALEDQLDGLEVRTEVLEQINLETKDSAFFAISTLDVVFEDINQIIPFDDDKINDGGHYNTTTGTYTAPVAGIYQFFAYIRATPRASLKFFIDGTQYANPIEIYGENVPEGKGEGGSVMVKLAAGQVVDVRTGDVPCNVTGRFASSWFEGHLLFPSSV